MHWASPGKRCSGNGEYYGFFFLFFLKKDQDDKYPRSISYSKHSIVVRFAFFFLFGIGNMCKPNRCQADCFKFQIVFSTIFYTLSIHRHRDPCCLGQEHLPITTTQNNFMIARHQRRIAVRPSKPDMEWRGQERGTVIMIGLRLRTIKLF